jgi:hypothetical protein
MAMPSCSERPEKEDKSEKPFDVIGAAINQLKNNQYKPKEIWVSFDGVTFYVSTTKIKKCKGFKRIKKFK